MSKSRWKQNRTVRDTVPDDTIVQVIRGTTREEAITELLDALLVVGAIEIGKDRLVRDAILERERVASTGIGCGIAIPHAKTKFASRLALAVGISDEGIEVAAHDDIPAFVFFLWVCPSAATQEHLALMRGIALLARDANLAGRLAATKDKKSLFALLSEIPVEEKK